MHVSYTRVLLRACSRWYSTSFCGAQRWRPLSKQPAEQDKAASSSMTSAAPNAGAAAP